MAMTAAGRFVALADASSETADRRFAASVVSANAGHEGRGLAGAALPLVLGGFRGLVADLAWLRVQLAWERDDEAGVIRWSEVATTADPAALPFWINGARMLAYDLADARWKSTQAQGGAIEALRRRIDEEQARKALRHLETGARWLPGESRLWIEMGNIHLNRRDDLTAAAACYARALALPGVPQYAERIYAGLLWRSGRPAEGLAALRSHLAALQSAPRADTDPLLIAALQDRIGAWQQALQDANLK